MRRDLLCAAVAAFLLLSGHAFAFQNAQGQPSQNQPQQQSAAPSTPASAAPAAAQAAQASSQSTVVSPPAQEDSLAAAARKAREQKKDQAGAKPPRVFSNDNIPTQGGVSAVGQNAAADNADGTDAAAGSGSAPAAGGSSAAAGEKAWRERFEKLRKKLEQDQADLDLMQRELGVLDVQYYNDPVKGMQQGYSRSDINEKTDKIEAKKKVIEADQQAIADAEDELHKAGGDPGWAR